MPKFSGSNFMRVLAKANIWTFALIVALTICLSISGLAADWPQWRYDANRSGATETSCSDQATLQWHLALPVPDPAYDHQYRMCADVTYAPVAAQGLVFIPSNVDDDLKAFDLRTGELRWRFHAEGPVRLAPVYREGKVYFGSDDGFLYCVEAGSGHLVWKVRGAPDAWPDSRMLVNGRLVSRWPVRGGPVVGAKHVFFGAGIWPEEGVFVCAVDPDSGKIAWRSDVLSLVQYGMSDHGRAYDLSLPPHGYLALIDGKLAVPSGRSLAAWFDPATGAMEPFTSYYVKTSPPRGTWYLSGIDRYAVQGGNWFGTRPTDDLGLASPSQDWKTALYWSHETHENETYVTQNRPFLRADCYQLHNENLYTEPVLTPTTSYASEFAEDRRYLVPRGHTHVKWPAYDRIVARELTPAQWHPVEDTPVQYQRRRVDLARLEFPVRWSLELESPLRVLIKAGPRLYAGGENTVAAIAIPKVGDQPRIVWQAQVAGQPVNALVADGRLVVTTDRGGVYCFGEGEGTTETSPEALKELHRPPSPPNGYALLVGWPGLDPVADLADQGGHRVVVLEPDTGAVSKARAELSRAGISARRVQVIGAALGDTSLTPYWANRVIVHNAASPDALAAALDLLRPFTGRLELPDRAHTGVLRDLLVERTGYVMQQDGERLTVLRTAPPQGADDWTHEPGGADNRFASSDRLVKWPLGVLWYSGDTDRFFTPATHFQHERNPYPLVIDGRMFIITGHYLHAVDIYTGLYLWKAEMPRTPWIETYYFDARQYGRATERHCVLAHDLFYAVTGDTINAYDTHTGKLQAEIGIPDRFHDAVADSRETRDYRAQGHRGRIRPVPAWTEVRLHDDLLFAVFGKHLAALDRHSGAVQWSRESTRESTVYAIGDGTLYGMDYGTPRRGGDGEDARSGLLFALDAATGDVRWEAPFEYAPVPRHDRSEVNLRPWMRPVVPVVAYNAKHRLVIVTVNGNELYACRASDGSLVWSETGQAQGDIQRIYPPVVTDDHLLVSQYNRFFGFLLDVRDGKPVGSDTGIPTPRTCARIIGNNDLLVYRNAATEIYDIPANRRIGLNSVRSGCTTSFIPAGGVMAAPMLGHGCVCNYPMFASLALHHMPAIENLRPAAVKASWKHDGRPTK